MKKALTIGELLVAMSIIGVVSVLVLPSFIQDYNKKIYVTRLRKTVATIEAALVQASADNEVALFSQTPYYNTSSNASRVKFQEFLDKYLNRSGEECQFPTIVHKLRSNTTKDLSATKNSSACTNLKDGASVMYGREGTNHMVFYIDVNGNNPPNIGGRDVFYLRLVRDYNELLDKQGSSSCTRNAMGYGCYQRIIDHDWEMTY